MPTDVYAAMRAMMRAEAARRPAVARTADPSPPSSAPAAPAAAVDATAQDVSGPEAVPAPAAVPHPVRRARPSRCPACCRAVLRALRGIVSSCFTGRTSRQSQ
ncbi:hypothetical protein PS467_04005 [Streptomyces luomodiensis]|uniref:Uncharacterized protein n=1 Tax=Streptomyces luomodiensis TaxID=3026192 RepID=A0ABY9UVR9_9ACTN|nr:hypothetical protein [Streptomyces sp. SCA4-21]WNE94555.1 hypothetical protein PS467_04005 [Streptomyces sp. SCA4-21]